MWVRLLGAVAVLGAATTGCASIHTAEHGAGSAPLDTSSHPAAGVHASPSAPAPPAPLRTGERFVAVGVADALAGQEYEPAAPEGGTDDYRCFLADPALTADSFITGVAFLPGNPAVVHHSILFRVEPAQIDAAQALDTADPRPGWECFGGPGLPTQAKDPLDGLDAAPWLAGWAPGGRENVFADGFGVPVSAGSRIVVQMHYNLTGAEGRPVTDNTQVRLRVSDTPGLMPMRTMLLPGPVELPCPEGAKGALCNRGDAVLDVTRRFGEGAQRTINGLQLLCNGDPFNPAAGATQTCVRTLREDVTVRAAAGHMHLLGRSIRVEANAGTARARTVLDIPIWDFDSQGAQPLPEPVSLRKGDTLTVTCTHDATLRDKLPAFKGSPPRYVVWGEGTTDEMCLGILIVTG
jgi:hypothetical protein